MQSVFSSEVTVDICRPTLRGVGDAPAQKSWFPLWMLDRCRALRVASPPRVLFYGDIGNGEHLDYPPSVIRVFLTGENIRANWSEADYALTHEREWTERHWRCPLWRHFFDPGHTVVDRDFGKVSSRVDRFCNFIYSNPTATERIEFFEQLSAKKLVDSCGRLMNNIGGPVVNKRAYVARCKFTIAFENESHPGYATEKIIEPLLMGSIPIYWGDPGITDDFNPDCLINVHAHRNFDEVIDKVLAIDQSDALWERYVTAPIFREGRLPENLSDEAFIRFFDGLVASGSRVSKNRRRLQVVRRLIGRRSKRLISSVRRGVAGIRRRMRRA
jgi:hypothetical protein